MAHTFPETEDQLSKASLLRRLAAMSYDSLLCIALLFVLTGAYMTISRSVIGPEEYRALNDAGTTIHDPLLSFILIAGVFVFFAYFWTKNGQTLGMQVWHVRVQTLEGTSISWKQAIIRYLVAILSCFCFGLGYLWILIDPANRTWHCIASNTRVVRIPKSKNR